MFKWFFKLLGAHGEQDVEVNQEEIKEVKPSKLGILSIHAERVFTEFPKAKLYIIDRVGKVVYCTDRVGIERLYDEFHNEKASDDVLLVVSHLSCETMGRITDESNDLFVLIDNRQEMKFHHAFFRLFGGTKLSMDDFCRRFELAQMDITHLRPTSLAQEGRWYTKSLKASFKPMPNLGEKIKGDNTDEIILGRIPAKDSRLIRTKWYRIEITDHHIRLLILRTDTDACKRIVKEMKKLRRQLPSHHVFISFLDNSVTLPKGLEELKQL